MAAEHSPVPTRKTLVRQELHAKGFVAEMRRIAVTPARRSEQSAAPGGSCHRWPHWATPRATPNQSMAARGNRESIWLESKVGRPAPVVLTIKIHRREAGDGTLILFSLRPRR